MYWECQYTVFYSGPQAMTLLTLSNGIFRSREPRVCLITLKQTTPPTTNNTIGIPRPNNRPRINPMFGWSVQNEKEAS